MKNARSKNDQPVQDIQEPVNDQQSELQETIREFFKDVGTAKEIEEDLWDMFQGAICNPDQPTSQSQNAALSFTYRMLVELLTNLELQIKA